MSLRESARGLAPSDGVLALAAVTFGATMIGVAPILVRLSELGALSTAFHRMAFASLAAGLLTALLPAPAERRPARAGDLLLLAGAGLFFAGDLAFFHTALGHTSVANATLLVNLAPVLVGLGAWGLYGERPTARYLGGLALAVGGAVWLSSAGTGGDGSGGGASLTGDLQAVIAAVFYAAYLLALKRLRAVFPAATLIVWSSAAAALALLALALLTGESLLPASLEGWLVVAALGLVGQALGQGMVAQSLRQLPVGYSSLVLLLQPLVAGALAWLLFGEVLLAGQIAGGLLLLAGLVIARPAGPRRVSTCAGRR